jgi:ATP-dependent Lon protease
MMKLARKAVKEILTTGARKPSSHEENLDDFLGVPKYRFGEAEEDDQVGVVTGLAWTEVGGELLTIEGVMMPGKGKMTVTGNLRDVMKESITAAAPMCARARSISASSRRCSTSATSTSTCPKAQRPRTVRRPVSPW